MNTAHYFVVYDQDGWRIQCDGENSEAYESRQAAIRDAVGLAHLDDKVGRAAEVIVQDCDRFIPAWDSTRDVYPPPLVPEM